MTDSDSPEISSLLSKSQRKWLNGEDALDSPDRVVRSRVKARYLQAIEDLGLLLRSDRIDSQTMRKWVHGDESTSTNEAVTGGLAEQGEIEQGLVVDGIDAALNQLEVFTGVGTEETSMMDLKDQMRDYQIDSGGLEEKWYPRLAVVGAHSALEIGGKTEKQARQWIEHHWPEPEEALEKVEEAKERGMI